MCLPVQYVLDELNNTFRFYFYEINITGIFAEIRTMGIIFHGQFPEMLEIVVGMRGNTIQCSMSLLF